MTGRPYCLTSGRISSSEASSPVTELTMGRPGQMASAAARALILRLSMQSGTSTTLGHGLDGAGQHVDLVHAGGARR